MIFRRISPVGLQCSVPVAHRQDTCSLSPTQDILKAESFYDPRCLSSHDLEAPNVEGISIRPPPQLASKYGSTKATDYYRWKSMPA